MDILYGLALTMHLGLEGSYNQLHPHVRLEQNNFIAGAYLNSEKNISPYAGMKYNYKNVFAEGGIVGGYSEVGDVIPYARLGYNMSDNTAIFVAPAVEKTSGETNIGAVLGFELKFK